MKSVHTILSSLLAGMMMFSLAACTASGTGASGSDSSAVQTDAVPQGRWVERQADGISSGLVLGAAPAALADGSLVLYARDESTDMPVTVRLNSTDNGASWQSETLDWAEKTGTLARWLPARTAPWRLQPPTPPCGSYNRTATRFSWTWAWTGGISISTRWGSCPMEPWWLSRQADRVFLCREIFCFMMWMPKR